VRDHQQDLTLVVEQAGPGELLVRVAGELDIRTAAPLMRTLAAMLGEHGCDLMLLDLAGIGFCDHSGLRSLHALGEAAGPHRIRIVAAHPSFDTILRLCGVGTFFGYTAGAATCTG
jgi:anti-anti-sigma factor